MSATDGSDAAGDAYTQAPDQAHETTNMDACANIAFMLFEAPEYFADHGTHPNKALHAVALGIHHLINLLILLSTVALCMETMPEYSPERPGNEIWAVRWHTVEVFCVSCFTVDFVMRLVGSLYARLFKVFYSDFMNWIDLLAIAPFYVSLVITMLDLRFVRVIRLARILRALRSERFGNMGSVIADILKHSAAALAIPIYFMMLALVLFSSLVYYAEESHEVYGCCPQGLVTCVTTDVPTASLPNPSKVVGSQGLWREDGKEMLDTPVLSSKATCDTCEVYVWPNETFTCEVLYYELYDGHREEVIDGKMFPSIPATFWWCIVTFTTVGYGDQSPRTGIGRVFGCMTMFMGIFFIAMPLTIVGSSFSSSWDKIKTKVAADRAHDLQQEDEWVEHEGALVHERTDIVAHIFRLEELLEQCKETVPHDEHWDILQNDLDNFASTVTSVWTVLEAQAAAQHAKAQLLPKSDQHASMLDKLTLTLHRKQHSLDEKLKRSTDSQ